MNEMITVTGKGKISLPPNVIQINISLEVVRDSYEETMEGSANYISILRETLKPEGFSKEDIKTSRFNVDLEYESYKERETWKKRFVGYRCNHDLKIEFPSDSKRLAQILSLIALSVLSFLFNIKLRTWKMRKINFWQKQLRIQKQRQKYLQRLPALNWVKLLISIIHGERLISIANR